MELKMRTGSRQPSVAGIVVLGLAIAIVACSDDTPPPASCGDDSSPLGVPADLVWWVSEPCVTEGDDSTCPESATFAWAAGGHAQRIATGTSHSQSPDGTWIATSRNNGEWSVISAVDGTRHTIPGEPVAWSANSRRLVTSTFGTQRLTAIDLASGATLRAFPAEYADYSVLSPDGNWLATVLARAPRNADGIPQPSDTPDVVAFAKLDGTEVSEVPLLDPVTGTTPPFLFVTQWTSDSAYVVVRGVGGGPLRGDLLVGLEDGGLVSLARDPLSPGSNSASHTVASPVRPEIAVVRSNRAIEIRSADGSSNRALEPVDNDGVLDDPRSLAYSHDGALLSYEAFGTGQHWVVDVASGAVIARETQVDLSFDGWIVTDGTQFSLASAPTQVIHGAPTSTWFWVRGDNYAYIANHRLHVAAIDGSHDEVIWDLASCTDHPDVGIHVVHQRRRLGW